VGGRGRLIALAILMFGCAPSVAFADGVCRPGDTLIGETSKYYYCSHVSCADMSAQLANDQLALKRLRDSMAQTNAELDEWAKQNSAAQKAALDRAKSFLVTSVLGSITEGREAKLKAIEADIRRADPMGTTLNAKLLKIATFEHTYNTLVVQIAALKAAQYPGMDIKETWTLFQEHARAVGEQTQVLASAWRSLATDPEFQREFRDRGFEFSANSLNVALKYPLLQQSLDFAQFAVDYGYDVKKWEASKSLILQNGALSDKNLYAECVLSRHLKITVRNLGICNGNMPADDADRPEDAKCVDHSAP